MHSGMPNRRAVEIARTQRIAETLRLNSARTRVLGPRWSLRARWLVIGLALALLGIGLWGLWR